MSPDIGEPAKPFVALLDLPSPGIGPRKIARPLASGEHRADGHADHPRVADVPRYNGDHSLVEQRQAVVYPPLGHKGQAPIAQSPGEQGRAVEPARAIQAELGAGPPTRGAAHI